jgi:hypothetical protein
MAKTVCVQGVTFRPEDLVFVGPVHSLIMKDHWGVRYGLLSGHKFTAEIIGTREEAEKLRDRLNYLISSS